mmetsp:Transcript_9341/g.16532  ORF Transcript_9341/g.16532 Transcript_9341/m.16532 type:complete len:225 (+) Transcript_9341:175-849(+)
MSLCGAPPGGKASSECDSPDRKETNRRHPTPRGSGTPDGWARPLAGACPWLAGRAFPLRSAGPSNGHVCVSKGGVALALKTAEYLPRSVECGRRSGRKRSPSAQPHCGLPAPAQTSPWRPRAADSQEKKGADAFGSAVGGDLQCPTPAPPAINSGSGSQDRTVVARACHTGRSLHHTPAVAFPPSGPGAAPSPRPLLRGHGHPGPKGCPMVSPRVSLGRVLPYA